MFITPLYIDASSVSIVVATITSVAIAVGSAFVIMWRKAKKKVAGKLHIDPNANKEIEEDLIIKDENDKEV